MERKCGACSLCCTALYVPELEKPTGVRCDHLTPSGQCGIYEDRPESCRVFRCGFLRGHGDPSTRPDRTGGVLVMEDGGLGAAGESLVIYTIPGEERWMRNKYINRAARQTEAADQGVMVVAGEKKVWIHEPKAIREQEKGR